MFRNRYTVIAYSLLQKLLMILQINPAAIRDDPSRHQAVVKTDVTAFHSLQKSKNRFIMRRCAKENIITAASFIQISDFTDLGIHIPIHHCGITGKIASIKSAAQLHIDPVGLIILGLLVFLMLSACVAFAIFRYQTRRAQPKKSPNDRIREQIRAELASEEMRELIRAEIRTELTKEKLTEVVERMGHRPDIRGERLDITQFVALSDALGEEIARLRGEAQA